MVKCRGLVEGDIEGVEGSRVEPLDATAGDHTHKLASRGSSIASRGRVYASSMRRGASSYYVEASRPGLKGR